MSPLKHQNKNCNFGNLDHLVWAFLKLLISCDFHTRQSPEFTQNGVKNKKQKKNSSEWKICGRERCVDKKGQRKTGWATMKDTVPRIIAFYHWDEQILD